MSDIPDTGYPVRMYYNDEETNEWIALANNEIVNVVLVKCPVSPLSDTGETSDSSDETRPPSSLATPAYEYYILGRHVIDGHIILECIIDDELLYVEEGPTFHYCVINDETRLGIKFQSIADAEAFAKAVRIFLEEVSEDYVTQNEAFRNDKNKQHVRFSAVHQLYTYSQESANTAAKLKEYSDNQLRGILKFPTPEDNVSSSPTHSISGSDTPSESKPSRFVCITLLVLFLLYFYFTLI